ncbi:4'-phosphopantetheinyl transferase family protein [Streptomyces yaizuensis]|uniref:4'-phosphopantetheinyl transferase superfamily protein n=1 Tax=Streptomyces yaizuensis TaxID=2989713 RepID=A0ABQ5P0H8_9ACTN|nr:4'-phosphopantetheinyl transferase superfamily protein [Streptomyces sp. YSPA8]GLF95960.1 4'-phosphopantetheinyl transferase superfamily protein [Streptomyces sp. YSPA8]
MATESPSDVRRTAQPVPPPGVERVWFGRVTELAADALAHRQVLDAGERARLDGFLRPVDRDAYAVGHVALRRLLGARLGVEPAEVVMERRPCAHCDKPHGRPVVPGDPVHFSLSHTAGGVLIALAATAVGVDIEGRPSASAVDDIAGQLHPRERAELAGFASEERQWAFARCWTRKEAYLKATGAGLTEDLSLTHVGAGPVPAGVPGWSITDVRTDPGYAAAVAVAVGEPAAAS